jgi:MFS family permease
MDRAAVARHLLITVVAYVAGSLVFGFTSDRLARAGVSRLTVFKAGLAGCVAMFVLLACGVTGGLGLLLALYGFTTISGALAYPLMTTLFGPEMTGRVNTASNVLMFGCSFAFQWGIGAVLRLYPVAGESYSPQGYATAFFVLAAVQVAALLWLLPMKERSLARGG